MNIGIDATALYGRYNGVEYALWNLLCALNVVDEENRYTIYIPRDGPPPEHLRAFGARWRWTRLPFYGREKARRIWWQQAQLPARLLRDGCDLLHAPTYVAPLAAPVPVVLTVYDLIALRQPQFATRLNRLHYAMLLRRSIERAHRIIVPSEAVQREVARCVPAAASRTRLIPLGVEPAFFAAPDANRQNEVRALYKLPPRYLLFVGNFEPKKNLANVLHALRELPDAPPLVLAGGGRAWRSYDAASSQAAAPGAVTSAAGTVAPHESDANGDTTESPGTTTDAKDLAGEGAAQTSAPQTAEAQAQATQSALHNSSSAVRAFSIGYVRRRDLPVLYAMCEAFVFPSLAEGFGLPVLEALASGAPVVTSNRVPLPGLERVAALCDPLDPHAIAEAIRRTLREVDWEKQREATTGDGLRDRARRYAEPFTWRAAAALTLDVYRNV